MIYYFYNPNPILYLILLQAECVGKGWTRSWAVRRSLRRHVLVVAQTLQVELRVHVDCDVEQTEEIEAAPARQV